jgi:hypothetical protein
MIAVSRLRAVGNSSASIQDGRRFVAQITQSKCRFDRGVREVAMMGRGSRRREPCRRLSRRHPYAGVDWRAGERDRNNRNTSASPGAAACTIGIR